MIVCTGIWGTAWERYGQHFAESFARFWPEEFELVVYTDRTDFELPRGELRQLSSIPGFTDFMARYADDPVATGREKAPHADWKAKDLRVGYSWSHDAVKWAPQGLIPAAVARSVEGPAVLCWLDADVETMAPVPGDWIDGIIGDYDGAYLGRGVVHSDIGFWAARLPQARRMTEAFADLYLSGRFLAEPQSHSAFLWDIARKAATTLSWRDLTPGGEGHVFPHSPLSDLLVHRKGGLKRPASP